MLSNIDTVTGIVPTIAAEEVMPRFRNLADHDVAEKKHPSDLVTTADIEAERRFVAALGDLVPDSTVIGEEGADANPGLFRALDGEAPVWLVDPVLMAPSTSPAARPASPWSWPSAWAARRGRDGFSTR